VLQRAAEGFRGFFEGFRGLQRAVEGFRGL